MPGSKEFINQELEFAAKRMLTHITGSEETFYRLLRQLAEIPWLLERGFKELAARNITALQGILKALEG